MGSLSAFAQLRNSLHFAAEASLSDANGLRSRMRFAMLVGPAVLCALLGLLAPGAAIAGQTRVLAAFAPNPILGFSRPSGVAIDEATGNVFVTDGAGAERVRILGPDGGAPVGLTSSEIADLSFVGEGQGIAYDNAQLSSARGTLYVFQPGKLLKFTRDAGEQKYKESGEIPVPGTETTAGVTVDGEGNVWLGDFASQKVREWTPGGTLLHEYSFDALGNPINRPSGVAVDVAGDLFVQGQGANNGVYKYPSNGLGEVEISEPVPVTTATALGVAYDPETNSVAVTLSGGVREFDATSLDPVEAHAVGQSLIGAEPDRPTYNAATQRLYVADASSGHNYLAVFGPRVPVPTVDTSTATDVSGTKATLNGTINPEGLPVTSCMFEYGRVDANGEADVTEHAVPCEGTFPSDSASHLISVAVSELVPDGVTYLYRITAVNENGPEQSEAETLTTASTVLTEAATDVSTTFATLHGTLRPEASPYTACDFEYGFTTSASFEHKVPCNPPHGSIPPDFAPHSVSASISGLQPNATYRFRLTAKNGIAPVNGQILTFSQTGPPQIAEVRALDASQTSATIEGRVNPRSFQTNYFFEWGPTSAYGNRAPLNPIEPSAGAGGQPVPAATTLSGLSPATTYHYRMVAKSDAGTTASPDHELETLNTCSVPAASGLSELQGLPEGRCFEMVSPRAAGPVAIPGGRGQNELQFQAGLQAGSLAYDVFAGFPGATRGDQVLYQAGRGPGATGWTSSQISPPILARNEIDGTEGGASSNSSKTLGISRDLSCAVVESNQPLTPDATTRTVVEGGGRIYSGATPTALTPRSPISRPPTLT